MGRKNRALDRATAAGRRGFGRPPAGRREHRVRFWAAIARGASSENAAVEAGVLPSIGVRWFRKGGGIAASHPRAGVWALSVLHRARGDRSAARRWLWGASDRASARSGAVDDFQRAATERCGPHRPAGISSLDRPDACGPTRPSTQAGQARGEPGAAGLCASPAFRGYAAARRERCGSAGQLGGATSWTAPGPALGTVLESGADLRSPPR
jgi:hypothetical protein